MIKSHWQRSAVPSLIIFLMAVAVAWSVGGAPVHPWNLLLRSSDQSLEQYILLQVRLPRIAAACLVGACLGAAGSLTQGLFRNPLASPSILGISSGGILCVVMVLYSGWSDSVPWLVPLLAFLGCFLTLAVLLRFIRSNRVYSGEEILLVGFSISSILSSITTVFLSLSMGNGDRAFSLMNWMLGTLAGKSWLDCLWVLPTSTVGIWMAFRLRYSLNIISTGIDHAEALGLNLKSFRTSATIAIALLVASSVALGGLLPFIGLIVPHVTRMLYGPDNQRLLPLSIVNGMTLVLITDLIARTINPPVEIQVGVIVSLIGSPFFLWLLIKSRGSKD